MIELDGSMGEGGGQILRSSLALSLITQKPFRLFKIRAGRAKPGLQPQHLASVRAAATIGQAVVRGDNLSAQELTFEPGPVVPGKYRFAIGTAGATGLVLHTVYLPLAWKTAGPSEVTMVGGTHVNTSPCFHFLATTWRTYLERLGIAVKLRLLNPGFYPRGGGVIDAVIQPVTRINGLTLTKRGTIDTASGFSAVAGLPDHIARRQLRRLVYRLKSFDVNASIVGEEWEGGPGVVLAATFEQAPVPTMFFALGSKGKPAEAVADEVADEAGKWLTSGAPVDPHSADQIVLPLSLADGPSEFAVSTLTRHLSTNIAVIRAFLERDISVEGDEGASGVVRIAGPAL
jgi:RNA 3'-terminal phosphate cyclase (ATP)